MLAQNLAKRARIIRTVRAFFDGLGFVEVETPVRIAAPAQEEYIDCPRSGRAFLRASPELQMKRLLCMGMERIYQIGPCFREGECGSRHQPEFSMLEWYRANAGQEEILRDTQDLFAALEIGGAWETISVRDAYLRWAGWDPVANWDEERFNADMDGKIEPSLPRDRPVVLRDYPAPAASLARLSPDGKTAERWELYYNGLELANAFGELCDEAIQRERFRKAAQVRASLGKAEYPMDEEFLSSLSQMPSSGGIALGIDRLVMLLLGVADISDARAFCQKPGEIL